MWQTYFIHDGDVKNTIEVTAESIDAAMLVAGFTFGELTALTCEGVSA